MRINGKSIGVFDFIANILFVPKCIGCGELLSATEMSPLCPQCLQKWNGELDIRLSRVEGIDRLISLAKYEKARDSMAKRAILYAKDTDDSRLFGFLANELARVAARELDIDRLYVTYVPRSRRAVLEHGFDQAQNIARPLAAQLGCELVTLISRSGAKSTAQKLLDQTQRQENAMKSYILCKNMENKVKDSRILLIDDVSTTGATLTACAKILRDHGAKNVYAAVIAATPDKNE